MSIFVLQNHLKQVKQQPAATNLFNKKINQVIFDKSKVVSDNQEIKTMTSDLQILLSEHNKVVKDYESKLDNLQNIIDTQIKIIDLISDKVSELETKIAEKKDVNQVVEILKQELENISRPSSRNPSRSASPTPNLDKKKKIIK